LIFQKKNFKNEFIFLKGFWHSLVAYFFTYFVFAQGSNQEDGKVILWKLNLNLVLPIIQFFAKYFQTLDIGAPIFFPKLADSILYLKK
jgi:hypothetical protein